MQTPPSIEHSLLALLDGLLLPEGFTRNKNVYRRQRQDKIQELGLRKSFSGDKTFALYFNVPEDDTFYELSPISPLKNTYWWPELLSDELAKTLTQQVKNIALAYFDRPSLNNATMLFLDALTGLEKLATPFRRFERGFWRTRGEVLDMLEVEFLADGTFAYLYASVWHADLLEKGEALCPYNASPITFHLICNGEQPLFQVAAFSASKTESIVLKIENYFSEIRTLADVKGKIRPEYARVLN
jgi:hypothetical protein